MPAGLLVTVPVPVPILVTVSAADEPTGPENSAPTVKFCVMITTHCPLPVHPPPLHPMNVSVDEGNAWRVIGVPMG